MQSCFSAVLSTALLFAAAVDGDRQLPALLRESLQDVYALLSPEVDNELCRNHSLWFREGVYERKLWALKMLDASSKLPSGILTGNVFQLGDYDECLSVVDVDSQFGQFSGQHCMVSVGDHVFHNEIRVIMRRDRMLPVEEDFSDHNTTLDEGWTSRQSFLLSVCVPSSCESRDVENHMRSVMRRLLGNVSVSVSDMACNTSTANIPLRDIDWCVIALLIVIIILAVASTRYDLISWKSASRKELLIAFSLKLHRRRLLKIYPTTDDDLPVIHGVRVLSMFWVLVLHFGMFVAIFPAANYNYINEQLTGVWRFVAHGFAVDTFFLISGLLACFNFFKDREKGIPFSLPRYYLHRYVRLAPLFWMLHLLAATLQTVPGMVGRGPLYQVNAQYFRRPCERWLPDLLFVNNYQPKEEICLGHTWSLSVDMQLYFLSPLLLFPLWRWPRFGKFLVCVFIVLGVAISVLVPYIHNLEVSVIPDIGSLGNLLYYPTHTRFTPWVVGIAVGYMLHVTSHTSTRLPRAAVWGAWTLSAALMLASVPGIVSTLQPGYEHHRLSTALHLGLVRPAWALGVAWLVFALSRGYGARSLASFLSSSFFRVMSRLTYSIYLSHLFVMLFPLISMRTPKHLHLFTSIPELISSVILSVALGAICHLLVEAPPIYIEKVLHQKTKSIKTD